MLHGIEIIVGDVNDIEARVFAQYCGAAAGSRGETERVTLCGTLRGPYCEHSRTLPAEFAFRDLGPGPRVAAEAVVPDPCTWSPELPHLYRVDVEARKAGQVIAEYHGTIGLRRPSD